MVDLNKQWAWCASIGPMEGAGDDNPDRYFMTLTIFETPKAERHTVVLWRDKSFDEAMLLLEAFQRDNQLDDHAASTLIDITELM